MSDTSISRGDTWLKSLTSRETSTAFGCASVVFGDAPLGNTNARFIAVVPDPKSKFPRARKGEVGLEQGWILAKLIRDTMKLDEGATPRPIVAVVDVTSQAYGRREEMLGIQLACAAAADAYIAARLAGHIVLSLIVGRAMSGAYLAHGYQANRIIALDDPQIFVHAMGKQAAARITLRAVDELDKLGERVLPMSYNIRNYAKLGLLYELVSGVDADKPTSDDVNKVREVLVRAMDDVKASGKRDLINRLTSNDAIKIRAASNTVREQLMKEWN